MSPALFLALAIAGAPPAPVSNAAAQLSDRAYQAAYNLDYDEAIGLARDAVRAGPDDPRAHRTLATVLWLEIIFQRGAVTIDPYVNGALKGSSTLLPAPAALDASCRDETARAIALAQAWVDREPKNLDAEFELGAAYALQASYVASVTGNNTAAFGSARRAYDAESSVLERDPSRQGAAVVVGLYRYIVSTLALPSRLFAYLAGFSGGKERGIEMLESVAKGGEAHVEAGVSLLWIYTREGRHVDALNIATRLAKEFPGNRLFTLEAGSAAVRAGHGAQADAILSAGLAALSIDPRPRFPGELSLWLLKRATARVEEGQLVAARHDLDEGVGGAPAGWIAGRIHLELGRVDDLESRRPAALAEYRESRRLCDSAHDDPCVTDANRLLDKPFRDVPDSLSPRLMERSGSDRR